MCIRRILIVGLAIVLIGLLVAIAGLGGTVQAQTPAPAANPALPWGLPPLPPGVGPVEKFADVSGTPQGALSRADRAGRPSLAGATLRVIRA